MIEEFVPLVSNVGFPIAMCVYFVVRFEKILNNNTQALKQLLEKLKGGK